eukprot:TRINITY_DN11944_c0_g1_i1.p1 TRINITY_DN11944_c0_g1~~TRINITY_DN11944_c0_g1_i1.p1  ORF type:complete len:165 (+),score=40.21 TRINITY_DN11944_c0_g1_i1:253-747(+)
MASVIENGKEELKYQKQEFKVEPLPTTEKKQHNKGREEVSKLLEGAEEIIQRNPDDEDDKIEPVGEGHTSVIDCGNENTIPGKDPISQPFSPPFLRLSNDNPVSKSVNLYDRSTKPGKGLPEKQEDLKQTSHTAEDSDKVDLVFDSLLKCYFDPKTNTYYELKQ